MAALQAGQAQGGDRRGQQSAALKVGGRRCYGGFDDLMWISRLYHPQPINELERLYGSPPDYFRSDLINW